MGWEVSKFTLGSERSDIPPKLSVSWSSELYDELCLTSKCFYNYPSLLNFRSYIYQDITHFKIHTCTFILKRWAWYVFILNLLTEYTSFLISSVSLISSLFIIGLGQSLDHFSFFFVLTLLTPAFSHVYYFFPSTFGGITLQFVF